MILGGPVIGQPSAPRLFGVPRRSSGQGLGTGERYRWRLLARRKIRLRCGDDEWAGVDLPAGNARGARLLLQERPPSGRAHLRPQPSFGPHQNKSPPGAMLPGGPW